MCKRVTSIPGMQILKKKDKIPYARINKVIKQGNIRYRVERSYQHQLMRLGVYASEDAEAQKIVAEPFPQQEELDSKEDRLKVLTDELNQAAIEAKKNAPKREKTCYFERTKMKRDAMRIAKKPRTPKNKGKSKDKKQGIE